MKSKRDPLRAVSRRWLHLRENKRSHSGTEPGPPESSRGFPGPSRSPPPPLPEHLCDPPKSGGAPKPPLLRRVKKEPPLLCDTAKTPSARGWRRRGERRSGSRSGATPRRKNTHARGPSPTGAIFPRVPLPRNPSAGPSQTEPFPPSPAGPLSKAPPPDAPIGRRFTAGQSYWLLGEAPLGKRGAAYR